MTKGRLLKFVLDYLPVNSSMDNFLFNIVTNRPRQQIYITGNKIALHTLNVDDYLFVQSSGYITHYMKCNNEGPIIDNSNGEREISVKDISKLKNPVKSKYSGQAFNKLTEHDIREIITSGY